MKHQKTIGIIAIATIAVGSGLSLAQDKPAASNPPKPAVTPQPKSAPPSQPPAPDKPETPAVPVKPATVKPKAAESVKPDPVQRSVNGLTPVTTPSGLKYYDIKVGEGESPRPGAQVSVHYSGWLTTGELFDSSVKKGNPYKFKTDRGVIEGWKEGIETMKVGGIRRLEIPSKLAYGERAMGTKIPANSDLIFEIELLAIEKQPPVPTPVDGIKPVTTESGLKYWDIKVGTGEDAGLKTTVKMHFIAWLEDGKILGTSGDRDKLRSVRVSELFEGWKEGVSTMKEGGKRRLLIPPKLAFGEKGGRGVPPNSSVVMEIELVEVRKPLPQTSVEGIEPVTTESGLKYWDIKVGTGETPHKTSKCKVHYSGWLTDGNMFDSSVARGKPFEFRMTGGVIKGWLEGVATMKVGGKRRFEIPAGLAYGKSGRPGIPPNSTLIFEIELLEIK